eukprot:TRINITY_DN67212_c2_g1_i1.p1 TRINITY_DN67212_c2_g1~~TRINITY_DN67212_c2_g1_i1.p1  ORF type:complete len:187 (-),score=16.74 TRINITY_DN67212_c2_g1_i1:127-687(-)
MGINLSKVFAKLSGEKRARILMLGLDASGKTTILYKLKLNENVVTIPTIGFNVEEVAHKNIKFQCWDVGGQDKLRPLWRHYFENTDGLIFVVDSNDRARLQQAKAELHKILEDDSLCRASVVVFANKQDLPHALPVSDISNALSLSKAPGFHGEWYIQGSVASTGEGLTEGLDWLAQSLKQRRSAH